MECDTVGARAVKHQDTGWLPNIIKHFQTDYPGIDYEMLPGDYAEIADAVSIAVRRLMEYLDFRYR